MRTPLKNVRGLGSARAGTGTFLKQRVTAIANIFLISFFMWLIVTLSGASYVEAKARLAAPLVSVLLLVLVVSVTLHMRIGVKEIIEDYVHVEGLKLGLLLLNTFFAAMVAVASILAVVKIAFTA